MPSIGETVGDPDGVPVGDADDVGLLLVVGMEDGSSEGTVDGTSDGTLVGALDTVGVNEGWALTVGEKVVGADVGTGAEVGDEDGAAVPSTMQ